MREKGAPSRPGTALAAFWWTLAAVHLVPVVRIALSFTHDPLRHSLTIAVLLGVIGFCLFAATRTLRSTSRRRSRGSTLAFLLAAVLAHHDAVGHRPAAELPAPLITVALLVAAATVARGPLRAVARRWRAGAGRLHAIIAASVDRLLERGLIAVVATSGGAAAAQRAAAARGPPA